MIAAKSKKAANFEDDSERKNTSHPNSVQS